MEVTIRVHSKYSKSVQPPTLIKIKLYVENTRYCCSKRFIADANSWSPDRFQCVCSVFTSYLHKCRSSVVVEHMNTRWSIKTHFCICGKQIDHFAKPLEQNPALQFFQALKYTLGSLNKFRARWTLWVLNGVVWSLSAINTYTTSHCCEPKTINWKNIIYDGNTDSFSLICEGEVSISTCNPTTKETPEVQYLPDNTTIPIAEAKIYDVCPKLH